METQQIEQTAYKKSEKTDEILKAFLAFQQKGIVIGKDATNPHFGKKYADLANIQKSINPALCEVGLVYMHFTAGDNKILTNLTHVESGQYFEVEYKLNAVTNTPQAIGSSITYAKRYSLTALLALIIDDEDDDGNAATASPEAKPARKQSQPAAPQLKPLSPDNTKEWDYRVLCLQNQKETLEQITKAFNMSDADKALLLSAGKKPKPTLKPGSKQWNDAVEYLKKEGSTIEKIEWKYTISEQDLVDLKVDAFDSPLPENNSQTTNTK